MSNDGGEVVALAPLNDHEQQRLTHCERVITKGLNTFISVGLAYLEINESRLYKETHATFDDYVRERWQHSRVHAYRLIRAAATAKTLRDTRGSQPEPMHERQVRELTGLPAEQQGEAWEQACIEAGGKQPTSDQVKAAVRAVQGKQSKKAAGDKHPLALSESEEWYTPPEYVEPFRRIVGGIDLDPASCDLANHHIRARQIYTRDDEGLKQPWYGRVWLNPPYTAAGSAWDWARRLCKEYEAGNVASAAMLVNAYIGNPAWKRIWRTADAACLVDHRICFIDHEAIQQNRPTKHNIIVYFGPAAEAFCEAYQVHGTCIELAGAWHRPLQ